MSWSQFTYYAIILGGEGVMAMIILITHGGGGPELGEIWLCNICMLPNWYSNRIVLSREKCLTENWLGYRYFCPAKNYGKYWCTHMRKCAHMRWNKCLFMYEMKQTRDLTQNFSGDWEFWCLFLRDRDENHIRRQLNFGFTHPDQDKTKTRLSKI